MQDQAGGEAGVVLGVAEEAGLQEVALEAPAHDVPEAVVETSTQSVGEAGVGGGVVHVASADTFVGGADQCVGERTKAADREREARSEQEVVLAGGHADRARAGGKVALVSVVTADVGDDAEKRHNLAFQRSFKAVGVDAAAVIQIEVAVGISEEDVAGRNLSLRERGESQCSKENQDKRTTHDYNLLGVGS